MVFVSSARRCAALLIVLVVALLIASPYAAESQSTEYDAGESQRQLDTRDY